MSKVSTPSRPAANAAKTPPSTPVAASPVENEARTWRDAAIKVRDSVLNLALEACQDDGEGPAEMAKRLLALLLADLGKTDADAQQGVIEGAFLNAEALIHGALNISDDPLGRKAKTKLQHALTILETFEDYSIYDQDIRLVFNAIETSPREVKPKLEPKQFNGHTRDQVNFVLADIATHASTLLRFVRDIGELDQEIAFEIVAVGLQMIGASADQIAETTTVGGPCEWLVGDVFYDAGKAVQA